jgi:hypothetical protein
MIDRVTLFGLAASVAGLLFVLELVRQRKLREDYSLLWLATALVLIVLSAARPLLDGIADLLGIVTYPPAALFLVAIIFMLVILLHFSTVLTRLARENKEIAQQMAILRWELSEAKKVGGASPPSGQETHGASDDQHRHQDDDVNR